MSNRYPSVDNFKINSFKLAILTGLVFSLQVMLELRIAYVILLPGFMYWVLRFLAKRDFRVFLKAFVFAFIIPGILSLGIHAFWLFPTIIFRQNALGQLGDAYTTVNAVKFFSFATFENSLSLLHPNWPENIFGKTYFMKPEFFIIPILAFGSLFFINKENSEIKKYLIFFLLIGILGAFLAKGANEPFGGIYVWLFQNIPGFVMFRDPTKWYTLVAISYSILIPFTVWKIYEWLKSQTKFQISSVRQAQDKFKINSKNKILNLQNLFLILVTLYLMFLIRPALFGQLTGTFKSKTIPREYIRLESLFSSQKRFFRTFWLPSIQRFGLSSTAHPAISSEGFYGKYDKQQVLNELKKEKTEKVLAESAVKYIIVPYDSQGEIFLKDRKYDEKLYLNVLQDVRSVKYLREIDGFGKISVFEVPNPKDHFWSPSENLKINYKLINPTKYELTIKNAKKGDIIIFSESFDKYWTAYNSNFRIQSSEFNNRFNSFILPKSGNYVLEVYYTPQDWVNRGLVISIVSLVGIIAILIGFKLKKW